MNYIQIDRTNCLEIILQEFPAFQDQWELHLASWNSLIERPIALDVAEFADFAIEIICTGIDSEIDQLVKITEQMLEQGDGVGTTEAVPDAAPSAFASAAPGSGEDKCGGEEMGQTHMPFGNQRQVQKFRYVEPVDKKNPKDPGYRILLATFADIDAAADDDQNKARLIATACQSGGGFVGKYYYQYEVRPLLACLYGEGSC